MILSNHPSHSVLNVEANLNAIPNNQIPIGNYKGIMLCNRPFADVGIEAKIHSKRQKNCEGSERSFICGTVAQPWGCNVTIDEKSRILSRLSKKDGALSKHKKWLFELQKRKEEVEKDKEIERKLKEDNKKKFMEREAKKRAHIVKEEKEFE